MRKTIEKVTSAVTATSASSQCLPKLLHGDLGVELALHAGDPRPGSFVRV